LAKYDESYNKNDVAAIAALYTADAVEVVGSEMADAGSLVSGREAIEKRYAAHFASSPSKSALKLVQVYAIGSGIRELGTQPSFPRWEGLPSNDLCS